MSDTENSLPKWACPNCGDIFKAVTQDSLDEKADNHLENCDKTAQGNPQKEHAKYKATVEPPRDLDEYAISDHFHSMFTRREEPEATRETIDFVVSHGLIKQTHISERYIFEAEYDGWQWWVVVKLNDEAFYKTDEKHIAVTIYSPESPSHERVEKYV